MSPEETERGAVKARLEYDKPPPKSLKSGFSGEAAF